MTGTEPAPPCPLCGNKMISDKGAWKCSVCPFVEDE